MAKKLIMEINSNKIEDNNEIKNKYSYKSMITMRNNNVHIEIKENKIEILITSGIKKLGFENAINDPIFQMAIEKSIIAYIILFKRSVVFSGYRYYDDFKEGCSEEDCIELKERIVVSFLKGNCSLDIPDEFENAIGDWVKQKKDYSKDVIQKYKEYEGNRCMDSRTSSLYAFIIAKSKQDPMERFLYLWIAINGIYLYLYNWLKCIFDEGVQKEIDKCNLNKKSNIRKKLDKDCKFCFTESEQIGLLLHYINKDNEICNISQSNQDKIMKELNVKLDEILNFIDEDGISDINSIIEYVRREFHDVNTNNILELFVEKYRDGIIKESIEDAFKEVEVPKNHMSALDYLTIRLPYYYRCKFFHADERIRFFKIRGNCEDTRIIVLLNIFMDYFLNNQLYKFFLNDEVEKILNWMNDKERTKVDKKIREAKKCINEFTGGN